MSKKSAPPPGGYTAPGGATGQSNPDALQNAAVGTAQGNRPNQNTPFGSSSWAMDPNTGTWTQNLNGSPGLQQSIFNLGQQGAGATAKPISDGSDARTKAFDSVYGQATSRLDPQWQQSEDNFRTQMANQGMVPGTPAYDKAYADFQRSKTDAYDTARRGATVQSGNAAQQQQQMDVTAQQAPFSSMNLIQSLMGMPSFAAGPDFLNAANATSAYNLKNKDLENTGWGDLLGGLFNMGGKVGAAKIMAGS